MFRTRSAASQTVYALAVLVVILGAAAAYGFARPTGSASTTTITVSNTATSMSTSVSIVENSLATAAQAECASAGPTCLTILTTQDASNWANCYGPRFDSLYPWAAGKVNYVSLSTAALTTQVISNYQANKVQSDVITGTLAGLIPAVTAGAVMNYTSPLVPFMNYTSDSYGPSWVTTNRAIVHMIYNPKVLAANNLPVPKSWSDLANPVYKNWIAFQTGTALGITTAEFYYLSTQMSNSSWTTLMNGIAANHPIITSSAGNAEQDVISGQAAIGVSTFDDYVSDLKANASVPIAFDDIEPIVYTPGVVMITNGTPHPNMAKLFEAFYISVPGQTGVLCTNHDPYMSSLSANLLAYLPSDYHLVNAYSNTALLTDSGSWSDTFKTIFGA
jgi:ABC-type Fe3+ transport system substrate-binding protein